MRVDIEKIKSRTGREEFEKWANDNIHRIHADSINEAAMGYAAGWDKARSDVASLIHIQNAVQSAYDNFECRRWDAAMTVREIARILKRE